MLCHAWLYVTEDQKSFGVGESRRLLCPPLCTYCSRAGPAPAGRCTLGADLKLNETKSCARDGEMELEEKADGGMWCVLRNVGVFGDPLACEARAIQPSAAEVMVIMGTKGQDMTRRFLGLGVLNRDTNNAAEWSSGLACVSLCV